MSDQVIQPAGEISVVGIGASAGGLEALESLFRYLSRRAKINERSRRRSIPAGDVARRAHSGLCALLAPRQPYASASISAHLFLRDSLPTEIGLAFVVIQHLSPDFKSMMGELLARRTALPVRGAENEMEVEANAIYLMPPRAKIIIASGRLLLSERAPRSLIRYPLHVAKRRDPSPAAALLNAQRTKSTCSVSRLAAGASRPFDSVGVANQAPSQGPFLPIDTFFRSPAKDVGSHAVGVILSGTGSDGSRGIHDIHEAGGLVIAQKPDSAKLDGMPRSDIDTGVVDLVSDAEDIRAALVRYAARPHGVLTGGTAQDKVGDAADTVFELLRRESGASAATSVCPPISGCWARLCPPGCRPSGWPTACPIA